MNMDLSKHQSKIREFYISKRRMPSFREMMKLFGYKSKSAVSYAVDKLEEAGVVSQDSRGRLIPNNIFGEVKVLGLVEAGFPSPAEEELSDTMSLDEYMIGNKDATYMLRVKGDSMKDAGILEGDMVLVERTENPKVGQIVVAEVDGEYTMKYLRKCRTGMYLEPANKKYKPIYPEDEMKIDAVVVGVIRKY